MMWVALAAVVLQAVLVGVLLWMANKGLVRLGQFTDATLAAYKSNLLVAQRYDAAIDQLKEVKQIRALDNELAAERAANFVQYDPTSDRERSA